MTLKCVVCGDEAEYIDVHSYCKKHFEERQKSFEEEDRKAERKERRETSGIGMVIGLAIGVLIGMIGGTIGVILGGVAGAVLGELIERHHIRSKAYSYVNEEDAGMEDDKKRLYELFEKYKSQTLELNEARELEDILEHEEEKKEQEGDTIAVIYIDILLLAVGAYIIKMERDSGEQEKV